MAHACSNALIAERGPLSVRQSDCGVIQLVVGHTMLRLDSAAFVALTEMVHEAMVVLRNEGALPASHHHVPSSAALDRAEGSPASAPPVPHDPTERVAVGRVGEWEVRDFTSADPKSEYFAIKGMSHVQLWHAEKRVSVLTPSALTRGRWQAFPIQGWKGDFACLASLREALAVEHHLELPSDDAMHGLAPRFTGARVWTPLHQRSRAHH